MHAHTHAPNITNIGTHSGEVVARATTVGGKNEYKLNRPTGMATSFVYKLIFIILYMYK